MLWPISLPIMLLAVIAAITGHAEWAVLARTPGRLRLVLPLLLPAVLLVSALVWESAVTPANDRWVAPAVWADITLEAAVGTWVVVSLRAARWAATSIVATELWIGLGVGGVTAATVTGVWP